MNIEQGWIIGAMLSLAGGVVLAEENFSRWEGDIRRFEQADAKAKPAPGGNLFVGSSSIRMWPLDKSFPHHPIVNRGFGGSQIADSTHFAGRIVTPHRPAVIVLYAGDNDIAAGKSPERVAEDFRQFVSRVREDLPRARIVYLTIKPSLSRWKLWPKMQAANALIEKECADDEQLTYVDVGAPLLGEDRRPQAEMFIKDGLHLSPAGYKAWSELVQPHLVPAQDDLKP